MDLCISSLAWNLENKNKIYSFLNDKNIKYIEIVPIGLDNCYLFNSNEEINNLLKYTIKAIEVANILDIKHLVFGSPKLRIIKDNMPYNDAVNIAKDFFFKVSKEASRYNIIIGIEPNSKQYGTNFLTNTIDTYNFVKEINLNNIGINLDLSTIILENENLNNSIDIVNSLNKPFHSHISLPFLKNNYEYYSDILEKYINKLKYSKTNYCSIETVINTNDYDYNIKTIESIICLIKNIIEKNAPSYSFI